MTETITVSGVGATAETAPAMTALEEKRKKKIAEDIKTQEELEASIPKPVGGQPRSVDSLRLSFYRTRLALRNYDRTLSSLQAEAISKD